MIAICYMYFLVVYLDESFLESSMRFIRGTFKIEVKVTNFKRMFESLDHPCIASV